MAQLGREGLSSGGRGAQEKAQRAPRVRVGGEEKAVWVPGVRGSAAHSALPATQSPVTSLQSQVTGRQSQAGAQGQGQVE